jgi:hypothetical protein
VHASGLVEKHRMSNARMRFEMSTGGLAVVKQCALALRLT